MENMNSEYTEKNCKGGSRKLAELRVTRVDVDAIRNNVRSDFDELINKAPKPSNLYELEQGRMQPRQRKIQFQRPRHAPPTNLLVQEYHKRGFKRKEL